MRGTNSYDAYNRFIQATKGFPVVSNKSFNKSVKSLKKALKIDKNYVRPRGWLAYAYVLSVTEGWKFKKSQPESKWSEKKRLARAERLALAAVKRDKTDYDTHWALANVYINTKRWDKAIKQFNDARYLCRDENNPNLLVDMADAVVHAGDHNRALRLIRRARRIQDWHRWVLAWAYFAKGRIDPIYYDMALEELRYMHWHPGDASYLSDVKLLEAVIYAQKAERLKGTKKPPIVREEQKKADEALKYFRARKEFSNWTLEQAEKFAPFQKKADRKHWLKGCRMVGLK